MAIKRLRSMWHISWTQLLQYSSFNNFENVHAMDIVLKQSGLWVSNTSSRLLYINLACLSVCLSVCLYVSNKRQNGWTDRAQIFCGTSRDPREGLWMIEILNICFHQNSIFIKFLKILKIHEFFLWKSANYFCFVLRCTQR